MTDQKFEAVTKAEVVSVQRAWAKSLSEQDVNGLLALYHFDDPDALLPFNLTLANAMRRYRTRARTNFTSGDTKFAN